MAIQAREIEDLIRESFPDASITITDLAGDGNHYAAEVIDESFRGQNRVQQQRAVYAALKGKMDGSQGEYEVSDPRPSLMGRLFNWMHGRDADKANASSSNHNEAEK